MTFQANQQGKGTHTITGSLIWTDLSTLFRRNRDKESQSNKDYYRCPSTNTEDKTKVAFKCQSTGPHDSFGLGLGTVIFCMAIDAYGKRLKETFDFSHVTYIDNLVVQVEYRRFQN